MFARLFHPLNASQFVHGYYEVRASRVQLHDGRRIERTHRNSCWYPDDRCVIAPRPRAIARSQRRPLLLPRDQPGTFDDVLSIEDVPFISHAARY